jgi:hypothetical protein
MTPDAHTPCPLCPEAVRNLFASAGVVGRYFENVDVRYLPHSLDQPLAAMLAALEELRPWMEAHRANQLHATSPELEDARHPSLAA